ncbi:fasciclin domain-containing protein [Methanosphaerula palustris]|uniref:Beta-Ig-H3/fasciclin n=1 Tax=Methanosphaerula palustris (strain ATCC BAA-1556 / DSM 19958 / E1-9c) TaxID=521011 RepID=B8GJK7_METPE|nr:fasciclin domain-containing protein [Methanosphaerula palustris]ACL15661.1 beta-Ig-H3/fasciclin [Methanosphaerula palustris E1-9c]
MINDQTILETLRHDGGFTLFVKAAEDSGVADILNGDDTLTIFAPEDAAFVKLPDSALDLLESDPALARELLLFHIGEGTVLSENAVETAIFRTLQGGELALSVAKSIFYVELTPVKRPDIVAANGVIHAIGTVLIPETIRDQLLEEKGGAA